MKPDFSWGYSAIELSFALLIEANDTNPGFKNTLWQPNLSRGA